MVRINENLIINESLIVKAEFSKKDTTQILTLLFATGAIDPDKSHYEILLKDREAWALWEYLLSKADRC